MSSAIEQAIRAICEEKGLSYESVIDAIQVALAAAYRKDFGDKVQNIETEFDPQTGAVKAYDVKTVVNDIPEEELLKAEEARKARMEAFGNQMDESRRMGGASAEMPLEEGPIFNPKTDLMLSQARMIKDDAEVGEVMRMELLVPGDFGRMAAMTAKQVITQKLREAEREIIFNEYKQHEGEVLIGTVQRREGRIILVDIGRTTGIIKPEDQIESERYLSGARVKVFVRQVGLTNRGPEILLSRTAEGLVKKLFEVEIPEIGDGTVLIKGIAREAGSRSKVSVWTSDDQIDPIGACIGQRGTRIQTVIQELNGEKIDVIEWSEDPSAYIGNALSPAKIVKIELQPESQSAVVLVATDQLSLAIGKGGQNVRLASKLTGMKITIAEQKADSAPEVVAEAAPDAAPAEPEKAPEA